MQIIPQTPEEYRQWWAENTDVPYGSCWCGCGRDTTPARQRDPRLTYFKGEPVRYIRGHAYVKPMSPADYTIEDRGHETPCWVWQRNVGTVGYGITYERTGQPQLAHRVYYAHYKGTISKGLQIDHLCRVRSCVNPDHLEPTTIAINIQRGSLAKLNPAKVRKIRRLYATGTYSQAAIGKMFGVTGSAIGAVLRGVHWSNVK